MEGFVVQKTEDEITIMFGGVSNGLHIDGEDVVHEGENFHNWTFDQLQKVKGRFVYQETEE